MDFMNRLLWILLAYSIVLPTLVFAQDKAPQNVTNNKNSKELIADVFRQFTTGKYQEVVSTLVVLEKRLKKGSKKYNEILGLIHYWRGMAYSRLNEYRLAEENFREAINLKYKATDLYYEYGQVLYVSDDLKKARIAFKKSFKEGYKRGVSLYYIAFISQELKDYKKAVSFYSMIEKLSEEERKEVLQAARMQIGDIYLQKIEKLPDSFKEVEKYVIPQYEKALEVNDEGQLADQLRQKIESLQRKYELIMFKMRNGRPTAIPPYYVRASFLYGVNDNVTTLSEDSKSSSSKEDYASGYYTLSLMSRYSFYASDIFSWAPSLMVSHQTYTSDSSTIYGLNNYTITPGLFLNFEHIYNDAPATFYVDLTYAYSADGADASADEKKQLAYSNTTTAVQFSEELQFWKGNASTFRFRYSTTVDDDTTQNRNNQVLGFEQLIQVARTTFYWFNSYDMARYKDSSMQTSNTNTLVSRMDIMLPTFFGLFNPTPYFSLTQTAFVEDSDKGTTNLTTFGISMNRPLGKKWFLTVDYSQGNQTAGNESDTYKQQLITANLEYIF